MTSSSAAAACLANRLVSESIRFVVTREGVGDTTRLYWRNAAILVGGGAAVLGLLALVLGERLAGIVLMILAIVTFAQWRFPIVDMWLAGRGMLVGSACEVWPDEEGLRWVQARPGTFETRGLIDWSRISGLRADDRAVIVMSGRSPVLSIPKAAVAPRESLAVFVTQIKRRIASAS
jgi:hypothetical protein